MEAGADQDTSRHSPMQTSGEAVPDQVELQHITRQLLVEAAMHL
jgi:hypothetical protein